MQNSGARGHPLGIAIGNRAAATVIIFMIKDAINYVCNCFKAAMWMPWRSLWFTRCIFHFTHLIEVDEWIKQCDINTSKCSTNWETFTFKTLRRSGYADYAARAGIGLRNYPRQHGNVRNGYCWHECVPLLWKIGIKRNYRTINLKFLFHDSI